MVQDSSRRSFSIIVFMVFRRVVFSRNRNDYSSTKNVVFRFYFVLRALVVKMFRESYEVFVYQIVVPYKNAADFITKYDTRVLPTWQAHNPRRSKRSVTSVARNTSSSFIFVFVSLDTRDQQWFRCRCRCRHRSNLLQMFICCCCCCSLLFRNSLDNVFVPPSKRTHSTFILSSFEGVRMGLIAWVFHDNVASGMDPWVPRIFGVEIIYIKKANL